METDYISREAAIKALRKRQCEGCPAFPRFCEACKTAGDKQEIKNIPAADVRLVVRGAWTRIDYVPCGHDYVCSVCGFKNDARRNYCPDCGASMGQEESNG